jgi:hypothetical protein
MGSGEAGGLTPLGVNDAGSYPLTSALGYSQRAAETGADGHPVAPSVGKRIH